MVDTAFDNISLVKEFREFGIRQVIIEILITIDQHLKLMKMLSTSKNRINSSDLHNGTLGYVIFNSSLNEMYHYGETYSALEAQS